MLLMAVLICQYTFFVAIGAVVAAMVTLVAFGSNDMCGEFSQLDSLLTHALLGIPGFTGTPWITRMSKNILVECS